MGFAVFAMNTMIVFWIVAIIVFGIVEAAAPGLVSIWFAIGGVAALITALFHGPLWLQVVWFLVVSVAALLITRPIAKKYINNRAQPTNAGRVIGMTAIVTETIENNAGKGSVKVDGREWSARSVSGRVIPAGEETTVKNISGVKLLVD